MAGMSRGAFYNHFSDLHVLMPAARDALMDDRVVLALSVLTEIEEPALPFARALRVGLTVVIDYRPVTRLHEMIRTNSLRRKDFVAILLPPLMRRGIDMGEFTVTSVDLVADCLAVVMVVALQQITVGALFEMTVVIAVVLRLLGVPARGCRPCGHTQHRSVPLPMNSLIAQSDATPRCNLANPSAHAATPA